ncbi:MAG: hypothetical protein Kow00121_42310 [Elainellaceae cyanobacterium]
MQPIDYQWTPSQFAAPPVLHHLPVSLQAPQGLKILLVEDNLTNQKLALRQLQRLGYCADAVTEGQAAIDAIMHSPYDLVLMDCQMPGLDGFETTTAIRHWESNRIEQCLQPVIVVAMTASTLAQDRERAIAVGMNDYLVKPVNPQVLAALLTYWSHVISNLSQVANTGQPTEKFSQYPKVQPLSSLLHLDWNHLHVVSDHSPDFELELLQIFVADSYAYLSRLEQAIAAQDALLIAQLAHHIRGASANVGAQVIQFAADQIETQANQLQLVNQQPWLADIHSSLLRIQIFIDTVTFKPLP